MIRLSCSFTSLLESIDELHCTLTHWSRHPKLKETLEANAIERMRLAVHEWVANLIQHADFSTEVPEIELTVQIKGNRVRCIIADNSKGFDLDSEHELRKQALTDTILPERGMGLPIIMTCTDELLYQSQQNGTNRIEFYVASDDDPCLNIPF